MFSDFGDCYRIYRACELVNFVQTGGGVKPMFKNFVLKQARKLGRCDSYLRNLKTLPTHSLTDRQGQVLGDAIASKNRILSIVPSKAGVFSILIPKPFCHMARYKYPKTNKQASLKIHSLETMTQRHNWQCRHWRYQRIQKIPQSMKIRMRPGWRRWGGGEEGLSLRILNYKFPNIL